MRVVNIKSKTLKAFSYEM